ncbi:hypothetical protein LINGRAHAP2_LOCUS30490, partial [Linum grandiflorum]
GFQDFRISIIITRFLLVLVILLGNLFVLIVVLKTPSSAKSLVLRSKLILQSLSRKGFL